MELNSDAVSIRRKLGEDSFSPVDIFALISNIENTTLVYYPMSERISGMCTRVGNNTIIAINSSMSLGRQRFSLAHELYHMYFHMGNEQFVCESAFSGNKPVVEREADIFASYFLAPHETLRAFISSLNNDKLTVEDIVKIEQYFGMSRKATLFRLKKDGYNVFDEESDRIEHGVIRSATILGYDDKLYKPTPVDRQYFTVFKYIEKVEQLKKKDIISNGKYEELLMDAYRFDIVYSIGGEDRYD